MRREWEYRKLGDFTYNVLTQAQIKSSLLEWILPEWKADHVEHPDQPWTVDWSHLLPMMTFSLEILPLADIRPRSDLMTYRTETYDFMAELEARANEREVSLLRGVSTEPLIVNRSGLELMDGYTRYVLLKRHKQEEVYAYVGTVGPSDLQA